MNHKVTVWAVSAALVATIAGCNWCHATDPGTTGSQPPSAQKPKQVTTPDGEVMWVVAEWDACCTPGNNAKKKPCKNAKCWQTKDGKTICVKPLRKCPKNGKGCPAEHYHCKRQNAMMCPDENPAAAQSGSCSYAAKVVQNCPANGGKTCKANEHVNMPGGKKGCAKADCKKKNAQAGVPVELDSSFETDEVFEITSAN